MKFLKHNFFAILCFILGVSTLVMVNINSKTAIQTESFLYPKMLSLLIIVFSILLIIQTLTVKKDENSEVLFTGVFYVVFYAILIYVLGFFLSTLIFLAGSLYYLGEKSWKKIALIDGGVTFLIFVIFNYIFNVPIPGGILW